MLQISYEACGKAVLAAFERRMYVGPLVAYCGNGFPTKKGTQARERVLLSVLSKGFMKVKIKNEVNVCFFPQVLMYYLGKHETEIFCD